MEKLKKLLIKSKLGRIYRIYKTTKNWYEVLSVYFGLKKFCIALLRSGYTIPVSKEMWTRYWECITVEFLKSKLKDLNLSADTATFEYLGRRLTLRFPKRVNFDILLRTFFYEEYAYLNVTNKYVIDVGAYIGDTAIYFALKGAKRVFAIEPYPYTYSVLLENIKINSLDEIIKPINAAIASEDKIVHLPYIEEDTITKPICAQSTGVKVVCYKLSSLLEILRFVEQVDGDLVLKMDCEGCEYDAILSSSEETLKMFSEIILEFHGDPKPLIYKLKRSNFRVKILDRDPKLKVGILYARQKGT